MHLFLVATGPPLCLVDIDPRSGGGIRAVQALRGACCRIDYLQHVSVAIDDATGRFSDSLRPAEHVGTCPTSATCGRRRVEARERSRGRLERSGRLRGSLNSRVGAQIFADARAGDHVLDCSHVSSRASAPAGLLVAAKQSRDHPRGPLSLALGRSTIRRLRVVPGHSGRRHRPHVAHESARSHASRVRRHRVEGNADRRQCRLHR
jgi:hypothetical protein